MLHYLLLLTFFFPGPALLAQDERDYRKMLSGGLAQVTPEQDGVRDFTVSGDSYLLDLNGDGIEERLIPQKRNGVDWLDIQDSSQKSIFSAKLFSTGSHSHLFRIKIVNLTPKVKVLILFLDEGSTLGGKLESQGIIYLLSFENNDFSTMKLTKSAKFFHEQKAQREQYFRRAYNVNIYDIDKDGEREIVIEYQHIQRVYKYAGYGDWIIF